MSVQQYDLSAAWDAARLVLDACGLTTYLFQVELSEGVAVVLVEHPWAGAWHRVTLSAPREALLRALDDRRDRSALAELWRPSFAEREAA